MAESMAIVCRVERPSVSEPLARLLTLIAQRVTPPQETETMENEQAEKYNTSPRWSAKQQAYSPRPKWWIKSN